MGTQRSFARLRHLTTFLYSNPSAPSNIWPIVVIPTGKSPRRLPSPILKVPTEPDKFIGLCEREVTAMTFFLSQTNDGWFFKANDDTWISPDNLLDLVNDLVKFISRFSHIVVMACKNFRAGFGCPPWFDGGIG
jgi:hypothetical protein